MPIYSRNAIESYRIAEQQEQKCLLKVSYVLFKELFKLFQEIAPSYKKQNRLISKTESLLSGFLPYLTSNIK